MKLTACIVSTLALLALGAPADGAVDQYRVSQLSHDKVGWSVQVTGHGRNHVFEGELVKVVQHRHTGRTRVVLVKADGVRVSRGFYSTAPCTIYTIGTPPGAVAR